MAGTEKPVERCKVNVLGKQAPQWFVDYLPITGGNKVELYIDGEEYGKALFDALEAADHQVLMTGLHFDPDWQFRRSEGSWSRTGDAYSLLHVLQTVARRRVKIYLLVNQFWKHESENLDPFREGIKSGGKLDWYMPKTIRLFDGLKTDGLKTFTNVKCRTDIHPAAIFGTHHQKTVVIDKSIAFVGGIDLTAVDGDRWDNSRHRIEESPKNEYRKSGLPTPLWHDVHCKVVGPAVQFVLDNFHARWNHGRLFKDPKITTEIESFGPWGDERFEVPVSTLFVTEDKKPEKFTRMPDPGGVYQTVTWHEGKGKNDVRKGINVHTRLLWRNKDDKSQTRPFMNDRMVDTYLSENGWELYDTIAGKVSCGKNAIDGLDSVRIQVVRSMPDQNFSYDKQKPSWNLSHYEFERATKDAYLTGIRAASKYIYIENQWCSDEAIWEELVRAVKRNRDNHEFRIVMMLPRKPLAAAGAGTNQDIDQEPLMQEVIAACKASIQFGVYCLVTRIPDTRKLTEFELDEDKLKEFGSRREWEVYVHSKVMIVDDKWCLIGSGNAGGISLEGIRAPTRSVPGARPDSELGMIIFDEEFAKKFRARLWTEHAGDFKVASMAVHEAADYWRGQAKQSDRLPNRIRFHPIYLAAMRGSARQATKVFDGIGRTVLRTAVVKSSLGFGAVTLQLRQAEGEPTATFWLEYELPSPAYELAFAWSLDDEDGNKWALRSALNGEVLSRNKRTSDYAVYIPSETRAKLLKQKNMAGVATLTCEVTVMPAGVDLDKLEIALRDYIKQNVFSKTLLLTLDRRAKAARSGA